MAAKKAKPTPKTGKLLAMVKKAKLPPKVRKLLAKANCAIKEALDGFLVHPKKAVEQMHSLPQVDVPVVSTEVGSGPPKKLFVSPAYLAALQQGDVVVLKDKKGTVLPLGTPFGSNPGVVLKKWADDAPLHSCSQQSPNRQLYFNAPNFMMFTGDEFRDFFEKSPGIARW